VKSPVDDIALLSHTARSRYQPTVHEVVTDATENEHEGYGILQDVYAASSWIVEQSRIIGKEKEYKHASKL